MNDEFPDVNEYVTFVLQELLRNLEAYTVDDKQKEKDFSTGDDKEIKERLRDLGYI